MLPRLALGVLVGAAALGVPATVAAADERLIVRFALSASPGERADARDAAGADAVRALLTPGAQVVTTDDAAAALRAFRRDGDVVAVEVDQRVRVTAAAPDDPAFASLWGLRNTGQVVGGRAGTAGQDARVLDAWDRTRGAGATVAVLDTGVALHVADLAANAWSNPGEVPANGTDDDANGKVDDVHGWNFVTKSAATGDDHGHGTHVAGTIAAVAGNATGVAGVAPDARVMAVKVLDANGSGYLSDVADGFEYAAREGADVVNASLGGSSSSAYLSNAIARHPGTTLVAAAGNDASDVDVWASYPCAYDLANVVCVGAGTNTGALASSFSNFGATRVDLAAPGRDVLSLAPGGGTTWMSGTSMATPHVAGAVALARALEPSATPAELRSALIASARPVASLSGKTVAGGTLDAAAFLSAAAPVAAPVPEPVVVAPPPPAPEPTPTTTTTTPAPAPEPTPTPTTPAPAPAPSPPAAVVVRKVRRLPPRGVAVRGTATGPVAVRVCRGTSCATTTVAPTRGAWTARVTLPVSTRRGTLTVRATLTAPAAARARSATARLR